MSPSGSSAVSPQSHEAKRQELIYRGVAGIIGVLLFWLLYINRDDGGAILSLPPLIIGAAIAALRLAPVSNAIAGMEYRLRAGSEKAAARQGKFARFFLRPFYSACLAIWRWTDRISDIHLRAGVRVTALIFTCAIAVALLVMAAYIIFAIVICIVFLAILVWVLSLWLGEDRSSGTVTNVTRYTSDWFGQPKQEHFDNAGQKVAETKAETTWLGQTKLVTKDTEGNLIGESKPDTDWLGTPEIGPHGCQG